MIKVGAATEVEQKEKQHRIEDAISATKAALEEGIVPGGGVALIRTVAKLDELIEKLSKESIPEYIGATIVRQAVEAPIRQIAQNAGVDPSIVVDKVKSGKEGFGFNAQSLQYEDLFAAGIIDPTKVSRVALQNATSVASLLLITQAVVSDLPEKKKEKGSDMEDLPEEEY